MDCHCSSISLCADKTILVILRVIVLIASLFLVTAGTLGNFNHDFEFRDPFIKIAFNCVTILAGILGIVATVKMNHWLMGFFCIVMAIFMGLNIVGAAALHKNRNSLLSQYTIELQKDGPQFDLAPEKEKDLFNMVYHLKMALVIVQALAFTTSFMLSYIIYILRIDPAPEEAKEPV